MINNLKLRQLRLLVALDSERKLQLAAERLNITQSAASKMLAEIEAVAAKVVAAVTKATGATLRG